MQPNTVPASRGIPIGPDRQVRLAPTADLQTGAIVSVDLRLYRAPAMGASLEGFAPTAAGFRIPRGSLRELSEALRELADELGA